MEPDAPIDFLGVDTFRLPRISPPVSMYFIAIPSRLGYI